MPSRPTHGGRRPGAGRPRTSTVVKVRVPLSDWSTWQALANRRGVTLSDLVRETVNAEVSRG